MKHKVKKPNVVGGGVAVPLGNNYYYMRGRKHSQGGIDIGKNPRTGLEVEDGEVMHVGDKTVKVYSSVPFLRGISPAQRVMAGENPNKVFGQQEKYKERNGLNDDGSEKKVSGEDNETVAANSKMRTGGKIKIRKSELGSETDVRNLLQKISVQRDAVSSQPVVVPPVRVRQTPVVNNSTTDAFTKDVAKQQVVQQKEKNRIIEEQTKRLNEMFPDYAEAKRLADERRNQAIENLSKYDIPYNRKNEIYLSTGRLNTGRITTDVLDRLYEASLATGIPIEQALGLASRESTFGIARDFKKNGKISGTDLLSNWQQLGLYGNVDYNKFNGIVDKYLNRNIVSDKELEYVKKYINRVRNEEFVLPDEDPIVNALKYYAKGGYNPGESGYNERVISDGREALRDPAILRWYNNKTKKGYGGQYNMKYRKKAALGRNNSLNDDTTDNMEYSGGTLNESAVSANNDLTSLTDRLNSKKDKLKIDRDAANNTYFRNRITGSDIAGVISNSIGAIGSGLINNTMLNKLKANDRPVQRRAAKLKTRVNINPQLDELRNNLSEYERVVDNNTSSSAVALSRKQKARLAKSLNTNELYARKENAETELINKDRLNQQDVANENIQDYNKWRDSVTAFKNAVLDKKSENAVSTINALNLGVQNMLSNANQRQRDFNTALASYLRNPNAPEEYFNMFFDKNVSEDRQAIRELKEKIREAKKNARKDKRRNG